MIASGSRRGVVAECVRAVVEAPDVRYAIDRMVVRGGRIFGWGWISDRCRAIDAVSLIVESDAWAIANVRQLRARPRRRGPGASRLRRCSEVGIRRYGLHATRRYSPLRNRSPLCRRRQSDTRCDERGRERRARSPQAPRDRLDTARVREIVARLDRERRDVRLEGSAFAGPSSVGSQDRVPGLHKSTGGRVCHGGLAKVPALR